MSNATSNAPRGTSQGLVLLLALAAATIALAGMKAIGGILGPALLALMLAVACDPLRQILQRRGVPRWVATVTTLITLYVGLLALTGALVLAVAQFATLVPTYRQEFADLVDQAQPWLADLGVGAAQIDAILSSFDLSWITHLVTGLLSTLMSLSTSLFFVVTLILFLLVDAEPFTRHLDRVSGTREGAVSALRSFAYGTRRYLVVATVFGLIVAVIDTGLLMALGVPGAMLWGLLAFVTNYVPNIGFVIGLVPPAIIALLEGGPGLMIWVIVAYCATNVVIQSVIQPKLIGDAVGISASITFLSLVVWAWVLGPLGAILAVPMTLLVKAIFVDMDPSTRWFSGFIGAPLDDSETATSEA